MSAEGTIAKLEDLLGRIERNAQKPRPARAKIAPAASASSAGASVQAATAVDASAIDLSAAPAVPMEVLAPAVDPLDEIAALPVELSAPSDGETLELLELEELGPADEIGAEESVVEAIPTELPLAAEAQAVDQAEAELADLSPAIEPHVDVPAEFGSEPSHELAASPEAAPLEEPASAIAVAHEAPAIEAPIPAVEAAHEELAIETPAAPIEAAHEEPAVETPPAPVEAAHEELAIETPAAPIEAAHEEPAVETPPAPVEAAHDEPAQAVEPAHEEPAHEEAAHEEPAHEELAHDETAHEEPPASGRELVAAPHESARMAVAAPAAVSEPIALEPEHAPVAEQAGFTDTFDQLPAEASEEPIAAPPASERTLRVSVAPEPAPAIEPPPPPSEETAIEVAAAAAVVEATPAPPVVETVRTSSRPPAMPAVPAKPIAVAVALGADAAARAEKVVVGVEAVTIHPDITPREVAAFIGAVSAVAPKSFAEALDAALDL